jgi:O-antigen/teichoic acid export membrane protein
VNQRLMIPVYREQPPAAAQENRQKLHRLRMAMSGGILSLLAVMAFAGPWLVDILYDDRYAQAGAMVVVLACGMIPQVIGMTYDQAALAAGDSRRFFVFSGSRAVIQVIFLLVGITQFGLLGALVALGLSMVVVHPVLIWLARCHRAWDGPHDLVTGVIGAGIVLLALNWHWERVISLGGG